LGLAAFPQSGIVAGDVFLMEEDRIRVIESSQGLILASDDGIPVFFEGL